MVTHVEFVFHYRITEFMRLVIDGVDTMEATSIGDVAAWMMKKISERGCSLSARFSVKDEDECEVDVITLDFLFELLYSCKKREIERVDFEVDSEPQSVCWRSHSFTEEKVLSNGVSKNRPLEASAAELDFDDNFIDFLKKLEQRQEMIKESALCLLSPRSRVLSEQCRIEKSVQTNPMTLPADVFVPELPSPDLVELHDARMAIRCVDDFVDSFFDLDEKVERSRVLKRLSTPRFLSPRKIDRDNRNVLKCWGKSMKKQIGSISEMECPTSLEDAITLHNTAAVAHKMQKWERMHGEDRLSMTTALSTGVIGIEQKLRSTRSERKNKKKENDEVKGCSPILKPRGIVALLRMLDQKSTRSSKLLKGVVNFSKEHKGSKSSKPRSCDLCHGINISSKSSEHDNPSEDTDKKHWPSVSEGSHNSVDVCASIKKILKEHEKLKKITNKCDIEAEPKKLERKKNQEDIRAYLVGRKVIGRYCKKCGAQKDIRDFAIEKKTKQGQKVEKALSALTISPDKEQQSKSAKSKSSSKQRISGKYFKLANSPMLAVVGESSVDYIGRLSKNATVYGKTFTMINLSRKEIHLGVVPINWPEYIALLHPISSVSLSPGETKNIAVTIRRSYADVSSECHLLSIVDHNTPLSHVLSFTIDALSIHHEGLLLSDVYSGESIEAIIALRQIPKCPHSINKQEDQVDSLCSAVFPHKKSEPLIDSIRTTAEDVLDKYSNEQLIDSIHTAVEDDCENYSISFLCSSSAIIDYVNEQLIDSIHTAVEDDCNNHSNEQLADSIHTAVEDDCDNFSNEQLVDSIATAVEDDCNHCCVNVKDVVPSVNDENEFDGSSVSDFEIVDADGLETFFDRGDHKLDV